MGANTFLLDGIPTLPVLDFLQTKAVLTIIIKFPYNTHSNWLKQRALSKNRAWVEDSKPAFKFLLRNFETFDPN